MQTATILEKVSFIKSILVQAYINSILSIHKLCPCTRYFFLSKLRKQSIVICPSSLFLEIPLQINLSKQKLDGISFFFNFSHKTLIIWLRSGNASSNKFFHLYMLQQKLEDFFFFFFIKSIFLPPTFQTNTCCQH